MAKIENNQSRIQGEIPDNQEDKRAADAFIYCPQIQNCQAFPVTGDRESEESPACSLTELLKLTDRVLSSNLQVRISP